MNTKIAIFQWGEISIHSFFLAEQLRKEGVAIDFFLYTPLFAYKKVHFQKLLSKLKSIDINVIEIKCTVFEAQLIKLNRITGLLNFPLPAVFTNLLLPSRTRRSFKATDYKFIIPVSQISLYWLFRTHPGSLKRSVYYSLEIQMISDPGIKKNSRLYALINKETKLLPQVKALLIQDKLRADALLNRSIHKNIDRIYLPVSVPGEIIKTRNEWLHNKLMLGCNRKIILYFGAEYEERKLGELMSAFSKIKNPELVLVIHGAGIADDAGKPGNIEFSNSFVDFENIYEIISSATIGIALYDISWPNSRLTAFASEKIARYLQAGVPFIAFNSESYQNLLMEFKCCELIDGTGQLESAINSINNDYETYRRNCYEAYDKYYNIKNTIKPLVRYIKDERN